jgi:hypothetical protein
MAIKFNRSQTFATNGTVDAPSLHNLVDSLNIYQSLITDQTNVTSVSTADELLIAIAAGSTGDAPKAVTVQELFQDALTAGTYTNANISETLSYGTATGTRLVSANATITTGTITTGVIPTLTSSTATFGTTTSTAASITNGTVTNLASTTGTITTLNSTTGTIATLVASAGTFAGSLVNVTTGTIATLNSTTGTIASLISTTGTITNLSTTLAGDFTISQGTGTIGAAKVTPANLSQPLTSGVQVATGGTAVEFTSIPSWVKKLTIMLNGVSTNGTSPLQLQLGSTTYSTSGYNSSAWSANTFNSSSTSGLILQGTNADGSITSGNLTVCTLGSNTWVSSHSLGATLSNNSTGGGAITLGGSLDRLRLTTVGGTQTFDAGTINIIYQG